MQEYEIVVYCTESGNSPLEKYMEDLARKNNTKDLAQIKSYVDRLGEYGMSVNQEFPHTIRKLDGDIYELRPTNHRVVFFSLDGDKIVLLHAFKKQHAKTPKGEIKRAKTEMEDYKRRYQHGSEEHI